MEFHAFIFAFSRRLKERYGSAYKFPRWGYAICKVLFDAEFTGDEAFEYWLELERNDFDRICNLPRAA